MPAVEGPPPNDPLPGMMLGDYKVERAFAAGGMGIVYVAKHPLLGRKVAVKVLRPEYAHNEEQTARFVKEAQAIAGIRHKGIVSVENFGKLPDGREYMVMEFLEGENLEQLLQRDAPLHANRALPLMDEVLDALSAAHKVGVVHRDLKPSNIFLVLQSNGAKYCKLVDFGLAQKSMFTGDQAQPFAKASLVAGTPEYVSPEQARGFVATPRTDLYCCGVILYEMLTGRLPFAAPTLMELLQKQVYEKAPRVSAIMPVPDSLDDLVASMLEKDPEARPRSADVVRQSIARVLKELKEASTQSVSRPAPLVKAAMGMVQPELVDTQISGTQRATAEGRGESPSKGNKEALPKEVKSDGRGKRVPQDILDGKVPREGSDGRGKRVPQDLLDGKPPKERSDGRGKRVPPEILVPPPEPKSDGRGKRAPPGVQQEKPEETAPGKGPEPITPKVDAQMERTLDGVTSGSSDGHLEVPEKDSNTTLPQAPSEDLTRSARGGPPARSRRVTALVLGAAVLAAGGAIALAAASSSEAVVAPPAPVPLPRVVEAPVEPAPPPPAREVEKPPDPQAAAKEEIAVLDPAPEKARPGPLGQIAESPEALRFRAEFHAEKETGVADSKVRAGRTWDESEVGPSQESARVKNPEREKEVQRELAKRMSKGKRQDPAAAQPAAAMATPARCKGDWRQAAKKEISKIEMGKTRAIPVGAPDETRQLQVVQARARVLYAEVRGWGNDETCTKLWEIIEAWKQE